MPDHSSMALATEDGTAAAAIIRTTGLTKVYPGTLVAIAWLGLCNFRRRVLV
jgi:uncharacterized membrane protein YdfJ with MMPL/SSD domain